MTSAGNPTFVLLLLFLLGAGVSLTVAALASGIRSQAALWAAVLMALGAALVSYFRYR